MPGAYDGMLYVRGEDGYEDARRASVWNARTPDRYPKEIVLDVSGLREVEVDVAAQTATVGPGCHGDELLELLAEHDLFFLPATVPADRGT